MEVLMSRYRCPSCGAFLPVDRVSQNLSVWYCRNCGSDDLSCGSALVIEPEGSRQIVSPSGLIHEEHDPKGNAHIDYLSSETAFARLLLWIRFPHLNTPHSLHCLELHTIEERLNFAIVLCLENGGSL
jgi:hypothetical protein